MFKIFKNYKNLVYGISKISDGNMDFRFGQREKVIENRKKFLNKLNIPLDKCVGIFLMHEDNILETTFHDASFCAEKNRNGDAMVTNEKDVFLFIKVADCFPVILFDPIKNNLALVHCGWRNTDKKNPVTDD